MGEDKAWLEIGGRPMIESALKAAQSVTERVFIVINAANSQAGRYQELARSWNAGLVFDLHDFRGPLGGIDTALVNCAEGRSALILACDLPFVTEGFLIFLGKIHLDESSELTIPVDREGRLQPMAGIYSHPCLPHVKQMLASDQLRVDGLCGRVRTRLVEFDEFAHLPGSGQFLININTREEADRQGDGGTGRRGD